MSYPHFKDPSGVKSVKGSVTSSSHHVHGHSYVNMPITVCEAREEFKRERLRKHGSLGMAILATILIPMAYWNNVPGLCVGTIYMTISCVIYYFQRREFQRAELALQEAVVAEVMND